MCLFQCQQCGCIDNSSTSMYNVRNRKRLTSPEYLGKVLCCVCGPTTFPGGGDIPGMTGEWHNVFKRDFLPMGEWTTNEYGCFYHIETKDTDYEAHVLNKPLITKDEDTSGAF